MYGLVSADVRVIVCPDLLVDRKCFNFFKESPVGFEIATLDGPSTMNALPIAEVPEKTVNLLDDLLKFFHNLLDSCDPHYFSSAQSPRSFSNIAQSAKSRGKYSSLCKRQT
ncbi:hypothetical protein DPMN_162989 [Dreissena polymorpha]|uniref:Uncharacterized protein n=1 Tax=Dreissena polymorpha TaxID=45954 RepID=A0A9D4ERA6_DREPO|nr:hypothetical protein DPMN_162989 [Dreissena polymorpha]